MVSSRMDLGRNFGLTDYFYHQLFITAASLFATYNIERALDAKGNPVPLEGRNEWSIVRYIAFEKRLAVISIWIPDLYLCYRFVSQSACKITPRSEKAASLIREANVAM